MKSPELQQLTASEPLTLEQEFNMQRSWREDDDSKEVDPPGVPAVSSSFQGLSKVQPSFQIISPLWCRKGACFFLFFLYSRLLWLFWLRGSPPSCSQNAPSSSWIGSGGPTVSSRRRSACWETSTYSWLTPTTKPWRSWRSWSQVMSEILVLNISLTFHKMCCCVPKFLVLIFFSVVTFGSRAKQQRKRPRERGDAHDDVLRWAAQGVHCDSSLAPINQYLKYLNGCFNQIKQNSKLTFLTKCFKSQ